MKLKLLKVFSNASVTSPGNKGFILYGLIKGQSYIYHLHIVDIDSTKNANFFGMMIDKYYIYARDGKQNGQLITLHYRNDCTIATFGRVHFAFHPLRICSSCQSSSFATLIVKGRRDDDQLDYREYHKFIRAS